MSDIAVSVRGLSKAYTIAHEQEKHATLAETVLARLKKPLRRSKKETFWALKDINFDIKKGDVVGIIGRNGAGKSTLLKILSRITEPTKGRIDLYGRVGSLLEVGTGFHPELTGRENVFLNGAILGMSKAEIKKQFDAIVDFAGVEQFLDTPVKRYSSGMAVRLAFAVAAHLDPEILIVDEVLAVGDLQFQKKCLGKMNEVSRQGRTVLFVSHDIRTLRNLCKTGIYLRQGSLIEYAPMQDVISTYSSDAGQLQVGLPVVTSDLIINDFDIRQYQERCAVVDGGASFEISVDFDLIRDLTLFRLGVYFKTALGDTIFRSFTADWEPENESLKAGRYEATLSVPANLLMPGVYRAGLHASRYGIAGIVSEADLQREVTVMPPCDFNSAHPGEPIDAVILMKKGWELVSRSSNHERSRSQHLSRAAAELSAAAGES